MSKSILLLFSFLICVLASALCALARHYFMLTPADWFTYNYSPGGWTLRVLAAVLGIVGLILAILARRDSRSHPLQHFAYQGDVTIALVAIAYEIAIPIITLMIVINVISSWFLGDILLLFDF